VSQENHSANPPDSDPAMVLLKKVCKEIEGKMKISLTPSHHCKLSLVAGDIKICLSGKMSEITAVAIAEAIIVALDCKVYIKVDKHPSVQIVQPPPPKRKPPSSI